MSTQEIRRALLPRPPERLRFYFFGEIVYADLFGYQHVQGFCFKVTRHGWHGVTGGDAYNYKRRELGERIEAAAAADDE